MGLPKLKLLDTDVANLAQSAEEQARRLTEMNRWALDGGIEGDVTDDQIVVLLRHQTALSCMILTLANEKAERLEASNRRLSNGHG